MSYEVQDKGAEGAAGYARSALGNPRDVENKQRLYDLRSTMSKVCKRHRLQDCGTIIHTAAALQVLEDGSAAFGGLSSCGSVWCCPVCSSKIAAYRRDQLQCLIDWAKAHNYVISMQTFTMQHDKTQALGFLWESLSDSYSAMRKSGGYRDFQRNLLVGTVKATEVTYGENGWHVHIHVLVITRKNFVGYEVKTRKGTQFIRDYIADKFADQLRKRGIGFNHEIGLDWRICREGTERILAKYLGKVHGDISSEMALGSFKNGRVKTSRTPFNILADIRAANMSNKQDIAIFREFEEACYYKRQLIFSRSLLQLAPIKDMDDEQIVEQRTERITIAFISRDDWKKICDNGLHADVLARLSGIDLLSGNGSLCDVYKKIYQRLRDFLARYDIRVYKSLLDLQFEGGGEY